MLKVFSTLLLASALAVGFVEATPTPTKTFELGARYGGSKQTSKDCKSNEFFWESRSCCLPKGGPSKTPSPPSGLDCPLSWYFHYDQGSCVPRQKPSKPETPSCSKSGFKWFPGLQCCSKGQPPSPPKGKPSPKPKDKKDWKDDRDKGKGKDFGKKDHDKKDNKGGYGPRGNGKVKRNFDQWDVSFCPAGLTTCPILSNGVLTGDSECVDTLSDLTSCGGCASLGEGTDCSTIPGASCLGGTCVVVA